jgi:hypothetical protein
MRRDWNPNCQLYFLTAPKELADLAICLSNKGFDDLEEAKVYRVVRDTKAAEVGCIRVVDESGEDYLYPASRFAMLDLPDDVRARLPRLRRTQRTKALQATQEETTAHGVMPISSSPRR